MNDEVKVDDGRKYAQTEYAILGCVINHREMFAMLTGILPEPEAFTGLECRVIYRAMQQVARRRGRPEDISPATVAEAVIEGGWGAELGQAEGWEPQVFTAYFDAEAFDPPVVPSALEAACGIMRRRYADRREAAICKKYSLLLGQPGADAADLARQLNAEIEAIRDAVDADSRLTSLDEAMCRRLDVFDEARRTGKAVMGISTGYKEMDEITGGLFPGTLTLLGGWYKAGKSAHSARIGITAALGGQPVLLFSYEMNAGQFADRFLAQRYGVSVNALRRAEVSSVGALDYETWSQRTRESAVPGSGGALENLRNFYVYRSGGMTVADIGTTLGRVNGLLSRDGRGPVALVIVDYLQLVTPSRSSDGEKRYEQVQQVGEDLASLAKGMDVPILALTQLTPDGATAGAKLLMGHCDTFWTIRKELPGRAHGMLHVELERNGEADLAWELYWDKQTVSYQIGRKIDDPKALLQEAAASDRASSRKPARAPRAGNGAAPDDDQPEFESQARGLRNGE